MNERESLNRYLESYGLGGSVRFHMPGHKGRRTLYDIHGFGSLTREPFAMDITEIPGADNLQQPRGVLRRIMDGYAEQYGAEHTELLVNGSTAGLLAAVLAAVPRGGKLLLGRDAHRAVHGALRLGAVQPIYAEPGFDAVEGLALPVSAESIEHQLYQHPDVSAVLITSPNYYGVVADVERIARVCHVFHKPLIVDQAHGAHFIYFDRLAEIEGREERWAAEHLGADLVVNSTHKTLLSFTGTGILNICSERVPAEEVASKLRLVQTTSPSYLAMASLEANERIMGESGLEIAGRWSDLVEDFYAKAKTVLGLDILERPDLDRTKINISLRKLGLTGPELEQELWKHHIISELAYGDFVLFMTGAGNEKSDFDRALEALREIAWEHAGENRGKESTGGRREYRSEAPKYLGMRLENPLPQEEVPTSYEELPLYLAEGRVLYDALIPYPPGAPIACPGEVVTRELIDTVLWLLDEDRSVIGVDEERCIKVGK